MDGFAVQWENQNALRKYPLSDLATCVDDSGEKLDPGIVTGVSIISFRHLSNPRLAGLYIGEDIVSAIFADDTGPLGQATATLPLADRTVALSPMDPRVSGSVEFGSDDSFMPCSLRFSTAAQSAILPFCSIEVPDGGVTGIVDSKNGTSHTGDLAFNFGNGVVVSVEKTTNGGTVTLSPSDSIARSISTGCVPTDLDTSCIAPVIRTFNGVKPDEDGAIALVFQ